MIHDFYAFLIFISLVKVTELFKCIRHKGKEKNSKKVRLRAPIGTRVARVGIGQERFKDSGDG